MKKFASAFLVAMVALAIAAETDISGKWSGSFSPVGGDKDSTAFLILKQNGAEITGTAGPNESEQFPIEKGKIEGDKVTLEVHHDEAILQVTLLLADGRLKGNAKMSANGENREAKIDVGRVP
jgi:hypothetical protein